MKKINFILIIFTFLFSFVYAQEVKTIESKIAVAGNCGECKDRIEEALNIDEVKYASWNKKTKMLKVVFESSVTIDSLKQRLALVGHDTDTHKSSDKVYKALPKCCLYRDNSKTH